MNIIVAANRFSEGMERICQEEGLSQAQYVALWVLCLTDDEATAIPIGAIADGLLNRASDTTRLVDRLEQAGLAERLRNPADRRGVLVRATPKGRGAVRRSHPPPAGSAPFAVGEPVGHGARDAERPARPRPVRVGRRDRPAILAAMADGGA